MERTRPTSDPSIRTESPANSWTCGAASPLSDCPAASAFGTRASASATRVQVRKGEGRNDGFTGRLRFAWGSAVAQVARRHLGKDDK